MLQDVHKNITLSLYINPYVMTVVYILKFPGKKVYASDTLSNSTTN